MDDDLTITREIELDLTEAEAWDLVADAEGWREWLVDDADVVVADGAEGTVSDDGVERLVRVNGVGDREVTFTWWSADQPAAVSHVRLEVVPHTEGATVRISETAGRTRLTAQASSARMATWCRWEVRAMLLWRVATCARV